MFKALRQFKLFKSKQNRNLRGDASHASQTEASTRLEEAPTVVSPMLTLSPADITILTPKDSHRAQTAKVGTRTQRNLQVKRSMVASARSSRVTSPFKVQPMS